MSISESNYLLPPPSGAFEVPENIFQKMPLSGTDNQIENAAIYFSLVIPTYNESQNVKSLVAQLTQLLDRKIPRDYELILVDDDSPDGTWKIAQEIVSNYPQLRVMRRQQERGLSTAVIRGWQVARGEILGVIDGDLQHPPETLLELLEEILRGADLAIASRHVAKGGVSDWSFFRRFVSRGAQLMGLILLPEVVGRVSDPMSGYFIVRRTCIANKIMNPTGYKILIEVLSRGNIASISEVGYVFQERQNGESKVTVKQYIEYLQHLLILRFDRLPVARFLRFGVVGFSGVFVDMGILYLLRSGIGLGLTRSLIISAEVAIINNFLWNDLWTFGDISRQQRGLNQQLKRLLKFNLICLIGLILKVLLVNFLFNILGVNEYLANLVGILTVTLWNFWINLKLSWRVTQIND
ncbi:sulfonate ABC transporter permease [Oscillatoriales cyanobacterium USR001]|nr:sulfonate ABC transporter permease [Oscillatoriales cyanobacterium USR001]